jgi:hypothetical protein
VERRELADHLLLLRREVVALALREREKGLVPDDGHRAVLPEEVRKVLDGSVDRELGQRLLLVEEEAEEDRDGAALAHARELDDRGGGVELRDRAAREDGAENERLAERAVAARRERQDDALLLRGGLLRRLAEREVEVLVEALVREDVVAALGEETEREEALRLGGVEVGGEDARRSERRVGGPRLRVREEEDLLPV